MHMVLDCVYMEGLPWELGVTAADHEYLSLRGSIWGGLLRGFRFVNF